MKKNGFCRPAMAGTALFLSIAVFPSQAAETGPGFEEAVEDTYDGPESPLEAARPADKAMEAEGTIIGTGMKIGTGCFHFILENDTFFISESSNDINLVASLMTTAGNRQGNGAAKTAA